MFTTLTTRHRGPHLDKCSSINLKTNLFKVNFKEETKVYLYSVKTQPQIPFENNKKLRTILIKSRKTVQRLIGTFAVSGKTVFGTKVQKCLKGSELTFKIDFEGTKYEFILKMVKQIALGNIFSKDKRKNGIVYAFLNNLLKNFFHQVHYTEIGKTGKYFDSKHYRQLDSANLIIFKGYSSNFTLLEQGLFLKMDSAVKIVRNKTVLEVIDQIYSANQSLSKIEKRNIVEKQLINKQVMANYGKNRYYIIDSIIFDATIETYTFFSGKQKLSLIQYYKSEYGINIVRFTQPLIKAALRQKLKQKSNDVILVPELLLIAGLPENFDERKRRQISKTTIVTPAQKLSEISTIFNSFDKDSDGFNPQTVRQQLGIDISTTPSSISGKQLHSPQLQLGRRDKIDEFKVCNFQLFNKQLYSPEVPLKISVICSQYLDLFQAKGIIQSTCRNLGLVFQWKRIQVHFDRPFPLKTIQQSVEHQSRKDKANIFWIILPSQKKYHYSSIKKMILKKGIQRNSQVTLETTLQKKGLPSIITKILLQMAAKVGNKLWVPKVPRKVSSSGILMIGVENYGDQRNKSLNILSFCSNSDRQYSQFYSNFIVHKKGEQKTYMNQIVYECLSEYFRCCGETPSNLIVVKNGSTKYDNSTQIQAEVSEMKQVIRSNPIMKQTKIIYTILDKDTNQKFFYEKGCDIANPQSGLLVNSQAVSQGFQFYLVAQQCNRGSVKPTFYKVVYSESSLQQGVIEELMYSQCFNYMNWTGSIKVPSVMQYAKKLGMFVGQYLGTHCVGQNMARNLYFI